MVSALNHRSDGFVERREEIFFAAFEDRGPGCLPEDVANTGFAMKQDGNAALQRLDGGNAITLDGRHKTEMRMAVHLLEFSVGHEAVNVNAMGDAKSGSHLGERWNE